MLSSVALPVGAATAAPTAEVGLDVVLLIDSSGSMSTSDPARLGLTASRLLIDLLAPGDRVALVDFDTDVNLLAPLTTVNGTAEQDALRAKLEAVKADGSTDYLAALKEATAQLGAADANRRRVVLFLTDGKPEPAGRVNLDAYQTEVDRQVEQMATAGIAIHTVALGNRPDPTLLRNIALDSGGLYYRAAGPADLAEVFTGVLTEAKGLHLGAKYDRRLTSSGTVDTITVDQFTRGMTVIATGHRGQSVSLSLTSNGAAVTNGVVRRSAPGYDMLTVTNPPAGAWQVNLSGSGDANLLILFDKTVRLEMVSPVTSARQPLSRPLLLQAKLVTGNVGFTGSVVARILRPGTTVAENVDLHDDGAHNDGAKGDGIYGNVWAGVQTEGDYRILVEVMQGQTQVTARSLLVYGESLPLITVDSPAAGSHYRGERMTLAAHIAMAGLPLPVAETVGLKLNAIVTGADGVSRTIPLNDDGVAASGDIVPGDGVFSGILVPEAEGNCVIRFVADGTLRGHSYNDDMTLPTLAISKPTFINVAPTSRSTRVAPGGGKIVGLRLKSESSVEETVEVSLLTTNGLTAETVRVVIPAGGEAVAQLELAATADAAKGTQEAVVVCRGRDGIAFTPATLKLTIHVGKVSLFTMLGIVLLALAAIMAIGWLGYTLFGRLLYRAAVGRARVGGTLSWSGAATGSADLGALGLTQVSVGGAGANVPLPGCESPVLFRIRTRLLTVGTPVQLGWASLRGRLSFGCELTADGDNRVSFRDFPKTTERLFNDDEFRANDYCFRYQNIGLPSRPRRGA
jgi:uncharacterized protein YegL